MSKIKLLLDVVSDLHSLADSISAVADAITDSEAAEISTPAEKPLKKQKAPEVSVTLEQVRSVLADKSYNGFTAEVRTLLEKYGAPKLSEINPAHYAALLADAEGLK